MRLVLDLDPETGGALARRAVREVRPVAMQAQVLLRRALKLPVPYRVPSPPSKATPSGELGGAA
jgi:hypothetical protein